MSAAKIRAAVQSVTLPNGLPDDCGAKAQQSSAVDEVIQKLWDNPSSSESMVSNSAPIHARKDRAKEMNSNPEPPALTVRTKAVEREVLSPQQCPPLRTAEERSDSPQAQGPSEKQNRDDGERIRQDGRGRSR
jgi:hypothetical protein